MVCDLRSYASANNIPSRFASPVAAEPARAAYSEALRPRRDERISPGPGFQN
jgi:hypothetical protein